MEKEEMTAFVDLVEGHLRKRGLHEYRVGLETVDNASVEWRDGRMEEATAAVSIRLLVHLYREGRYSVQSTSDVRPESLAAFLDKAETFLDLMPPDPYRVPVDPSLQYPVERELAIFEPEAARISPERMGDWARELYDLARAEDGRITEASANAQRDIIRSVETFSSGFRTVREGTVLNRGISVSTLSSDRTRPQGGDYSISRSVSRLKPLEELSRRAVDDCLARIGQAKIASGVYDVVFERDTAGWPVAWLIGGLTSQALDQKRSIFDGKRGQSIGSKSLSLKDDPFVPGGLGSRLCDPDGMASRQRDIVRDGILEDYYVDWYYSRKSGLAPNSGNVSNLVMEGPTTSREDLIAGVPKGLLVRNLLGGNHNPVTGDFSVGIDGFEIGNGKVLGPVNEMTISGNMRDFWARLDAIGDDPEDRDRYRIPSLRFRGIEAAGK